MTDDPTNDDLPPNDDVANEPDGDAASAEERELAVELVTLLRQRQKIAAVKRYREATGASLSEAVTFVNRIAAEHGLSQPSGCGSKAAALLLVAVITLHWLV